MGNKFIHASSNSEKIINSLKNLDESTEKGLKRGLYKYSSSLSVKIRDSINNKDPSGRLYEISTPSGVISHRASAPGQAPANLSGALKASIKTKVMGARQMEVSAGDLSGVNPTLRYGIKAPGNTLKYARELELGEGIDKRPYIKPKIDSGHRDAVRYLTKGIAEEITKSANK